MAKTTRRARSAFDELIASGVRPTGVFVMSTDPNVTGIYGDVGFDWVLIDREHGLMDNRDMRAHLLAADASGLVPVVRVLENNPAMIQQTLDAGAQAVMIPKVGNADDAKKAVAAARYAPGGRGMCSVVPASNFTGRNWSTYANELNENVLVIALIETQRGVDNIAEICAVEGVDYIFFGLADLSQDIGVDMIADIDVLLELWTRVATTAHEHGVRAGAPFGYGFEGLADYGSIGSDLTNLRAAAEKSLAGARESSGR